MDFQSPDAVRLTAMFENIYIVLSSRNQYFKSHSSTDPTAVPFRADSIGIGEIQLLEALVLSVV
jgi:hypothetical protein